MLFDCCNLRINLKKLLFIASMTLIIFYLYTLVTLSYFPIYPDEIAIRVWLSRTGFDFPMRVNIIPSCESYLLPLSLVWMIPGTVEWLLHGLLDNLQTLRATGLVFYELMVSMLAFMLVINDNAVKSNKILLYMIVVGLGAVISLLAVGVMPASLVTNRPEQMILFCLIILLYLYNLKVSEALNRRKLALVTTIVFFFSVSMILYVHPKGLYFTPFFLLVAYKVFSSFRNTILILVLFALLLIQILGNYYAWNGQMQCQQSPSVAQYLMSFNINPGDILHDSVRFQEQLGTSLADEDKLLSRLGFEERAEVRYLPDVVLHFKEVIVNDIIEYNAVILLATLLILLFFKYCSDIRNKDYLSSRLLLLVLISCAIGGNLLNLSKHWYDVTYFWSVISIAAIVFASPYFRRMLDHTLGLGILLYLIASAISSLYVFNRDFREQFMNGYVGPGVFLNDYNYKEYLTDASNAAKGCKIDPHNSSGLVLDDYTYLYFKQSKYPLLVTYINLHTDKNIIPELIKDNIIKAVVVRCGSINAMPDLKKVHVLQFGKICCYPESEINQLK